MKLYTADAIKEQVHKLLCQDCEETDVCPICDYRELIDEILDATTVDAVEVVRCKDCCRSSVEYWTRDGLRKTDDKHLFCKMVHHLMRLDDFCSWGERREDGLDSDSTLGNP